MPELPDVQVWKEYVDATSLHQRITGVRSDAADLREGMDDAALEERLRGRRLRSARRHGKHLFVEAEDDGWLRLHFGMTGSLRYYRDAGTPEHAKLVLDFPDDCHLAFVNVRKLGQIGFVDDPDAFVDREGLGPDLLDLDRRGFRDCFQGRGGMLKSALMDQSVVAGLGNVYTDETLLRAGLHPESPVDDLAPEALDRLYRSSREVVDAAVEARVEVERMPDDFLLGRRAEGEPCPRCGHELRKTEVSGRPTYLCPGHQERTS